MLSVAASGHFHFGDRSMGQIKQRSGKSFKFSSETIVLKVTTYATKHRRHRF